MPPGAEPRSRDSRVLTTTSEIMLRRPRAMQFMAELVIVGDIVGNGGKSADAIEIGSPKRQRRTQAEFRNAEQPGYQCAGREVGRDGERFEAAGPVVRFRAIQAGDQPNAGIGQRRGHVADVPGGTQMSLSLTIRIG